MTDPQRTFPCSVTDCEEDTTVIEADDKWTVVECDEHQARTRWETNPREVEPVQMMSLGWKNYAITGRK